MDTLIFIVGFLGFFLSVIMLIVSMIRKKPKKKFLVLILTCIIMVVVGANMSTDKDDQENISTVPEKPEEVIDVKSVNATDTEQIETEPESIKISAKDLYQAYKDNEVAADNKYKNETLEITGTINNIGKDVVDTIYITLDVEEYISSVQCYFKDSKSDEVAKLSKGQEITITGRCDGMSLSNVIIKNSNIVE